MVEINENAEQINTKTISVSAAAAAAVVVVVAAVVVDDDASAAAVVVLFVRCMHRHDRCFTCTSSAHLEADVRSKRHKTPQKKKKEKEQKQQQQRK